MGEEVLQIPLNGSKSTNSFPLYVIQSVNIIERALFDGLSSGYNQRTRAFFWGNRS